LPGPRNYAVPQPAHQRPTKWHIRGVHCTVPQLVCGQNIPAVMPTVLEEWPSLRQSDMLQIHFKILQSLYHPLLH
jgi:hypothetical protein